MALNTDTAKFVIGLSEGTGIDPRVVIAWMDQEGAFSGQESGAYNYLNIMGSNGQPLSFNDEKDGLDATLTLLHQPQYKMIIHTAATKPTPEQQISSIAASGWDKNHYGGNGGINLRKTFASVFTNAGLSDQYEDPSNAQMIANDIGGHGIGKSASDIGSYDLGNAGHDIATFTGLSSFADLLGWLEGNWDRVLIVIGGGIALIIGVVLLVKSTQNKQNTFTFARGDE